MIWFGCVHVERQVKQAFLMASGRYSGDGIYFNRFKIGEMDKKNCLLVVQC